MFTANTVPVAHVTADEKSWLLMVTAPGVVAHIVHQQTVSK